VVSTQSTTRYWRDFFFFFFFFLKGIGVILFRVIVGCVRSVPKDVKLRNNKQDKYLSRIILGLPINKPFVTREH
jgi:hypothetical protein